MSRFARWSRTHPLQRNLIGLGLILPPLVLLLLAAGLISRSSTSAPPTPYTAATEAPPPQAQPSPTTSAEQLDQAFRQAQPVATAFLEHYASYRWDDPPGSLRSRLHPYVTPSLKATLASSSGASAATAAQAAGHESTIGQVSQLTPLRLDPEGHLDLAGVVEQLTITDSGSHQGSVSIEVTLVQTEAGWRVDQVQL
jgi:hypothetical protein